jgi:hypothetical protein
MAGDIQVSFPAAQVFPAFVADTFDQLILSCESVFPQPDGEAIIIAKRGLASAKLVKGQKKYLILSDATA